MPDFLHGGIFVFVTVSPVFGATVIASQLLPNLVEECFMVHPEEIQPSTNLRVILLNELVRVLSVQWQGTDAMTLMYRDQHGNVAHERFFRADEDRLPLVDHGCPWRFNEDVQTKLAAPDTRYDLVMIVMFQPDGSTAVRYVRRPFRREPDFGVTSVTYHVADLWSRGEHPL